MEIVNIDYGEELEKMRFGHFDNKTKAVQRDPSFYEMILNRKKICFILY